MCVRHVQYAKATCHPSLSEEALEDLTEAYVELRQRMRTREIEMRVTPRSLESIIRCAAHTLHSAPARRRHPPSSPQVIILNHVSFTALLRIAKQHGLA